MAAALKSRYADRPLIIRSNRALRAEVMDIFDQTFAVTRTLQAMALLIAVCGVSLTLLVQARERAGELALLRALGATRRQIFVLFLGEGAGMGLFGLGMGLFGGVGLAALLILVINREWFGWTIQPTWPAGAIAAADPDHSGRGGRRSRLPGPAGRTFIPGQLSRDDL